jgi:hypothetical protein
MSDDAEDFVPVWEGPYAEASARMSWIEAALIPVDLDDGSAPGRASVVVPSAYVREAQGVLAGGQPPVRRAHRSGGIAPWHVALAVILVLVLLAAIVL